MNSRQKHAALKRLVLLVSLLLVVLLSSEGISAAAALRRGDRGDDVISVQKKLKNWGYYNGTVDGVFGAQTESAVMTFQRKNGLRRRL